VVVEIADLVDLLGLMSTIIMKAALIAFFVVIALAGQSQRQYYVFVESENSQPFYVRLGEAIHTSSGVGHVIVSQLIDSTYTFEIGFPKDQYPSNQFVIRINKKDHGYQLKNLTGKGWVLFDYQTAELLYPVKKEGIAQSGYSLVKKEDGFARLLSEVVNDTSVLYSIVYEKPIEPVVKKEKVVAQDTALKKEDVVTKQNAEPLKEVPALVGVSLIGQKQSDSGRQMTFKDDKDSVSIFIPVEQEVQKQTAAPQDDDKKKQSETDNKKENSNQPNNIKQEAVAVVPIVTADSVLKKSEPAVSKEAIDSSHKVVQEKTVDTASQQKKLVLLNSDCKAIAWDNDVDKLRIKMLGEKDVDNKITLARKIFKTKCFSASQIKGLTELFVTDQDKYKFLDAAYPFVVDTDNFKQLSYLLSDDYYVKRFRTMVRLD